MNGGIGKFVRAILVIIVRQTSQGYDVRAGQDIIAIELYLVALSILVAVKHHICIRLIPYALHRLPCFIPIIFGTLVTQPYTHLDRFVHEGRAELRSLKSILNSIADVENAIKACTVEMAGKTSGTDFYAWLKEIGALGKDARGITRGTPWWPGAYQN